MGLCRNYMDESNEPHYYNKNVSTPKETNLNYQARVHTNLRGVDTICGTCNVSFFHWFDAMKWMPWNPSLN